MPRLRNSEVEERNNKDHRGNKIETKQRVEKINETKSWLLER